MAYALLADLKAYLGLATAAEDTLLQGCLDDAQGFIEGPGGVGRLFQVTQDSTRTLDAIRDVADYFLTLWLDQDLCQITSITNGDGAAIQPAQYVTNPRNETPYYSIQFKWSASNAWTFSDTPEGAVAITGRWGYSTSAPRDIHHAHLRLAAWYYRQKSSSADIDRAFVAQGGVMVMPSRIPRDVEDILARYRRTTPR